MAEEQDILKKGAVLSSQMILSSILLKEKDKNVRHMVVEIVEVSDTVTTIRLDKVQHHSAVRSGLGLTKVCDYLLVTQAVESITRSLSN